MAKSLLDKILDNIFDAEFIGRRGEKLTERELNLVKLFGRKGTVLRNLYVPTKDGKTSEIDVVFITQKGIFVIESKNYSGWIFGDEQSLYWTASLPNGEKNRFYNPIKQNATHIKWLSVYLGEEVPLFSIIVFSERCELKKIRLDSDNIKVVKRDRLYATVRDIWDASPDSLGAETLEKMVERLKELTNVDAGVKQSHIDDINEKYHGNTSSAVDVSPEVIVATDDTDNICPKCGKTLILRTAKKGDNAGRQFYGCSSFPMCRYIKNID